MRMAIILVCVLVITFPLSFQRTPDKPDTPDPLELSELATEINKQLEGQPDDMPARYAGWFRAIGDTLENGDEPLKDLRRAWSKSRTIIGLPGSLGALVQSHLQEFETSDADRSEYAAAWYQLADACEELDK